MEVPVTSPRNNSSLASSLRDAQILLAYAAQNGIAIDGATIKSVVAAASLHASNSMTDDDEAGFWAAFNLLAKTVAPVTVGSLRSIMDVEASERTLFGLHFRKSPLARKAVRWYTTLAIVTLATLLVVQIYWLFGAKITSDIQKTSETQSKVGASLRSAEKLAAQLASKPKNAPPEEATAPAATEVDIPSLRAQKETLSMKEESSYEALAGWSAVWGNFLPEFACETRENPPKCKIYANTVLLQSSSLVLEALQRYLLPLLYGLLGTCVYVLRTLAAEISRRTYSEASNIGFRIRLYLGTLGGMVFAWFLIPESTDSLFKSLSPFALAFLSGYSVELLFAAMDRFLAAFTSKGP